MVSEKSLAFQEAWQAMAQEWMRIQFRYAASCWDVALGMFSKGLAPIQRRAIANARRLAR
jgi:hypothetical protein